MSGEPIPEAALDALTGKWRPQVTVPIGDRVYDCWSLVDDPNELTYTVETDGEWAKVRFWQHGLIVSEWRYPS